MQGIGAALAEVADLVSSSGIPCVVDVSTLQVPGAWVEVSSSETDPIAFQTLGGEDYELSVTVYLVAPNNGMTEGLDKLSGMLTQLRAVLPVRSARPAIVSLVNHGGDLPALIINKSFDISGENA